MSLFRVLNDLGPPVICYHDTVHIAIKIPLIYLILPFCSMYYVFADSAWTVEMFTWESICCISKRSRVLTSKIMLKVLGLSSYISIIPAMTEHRRVGSYSLANLGNWWSPQQCQTLPHKRNVDSSWRTIYALIQACSLYDQILQTTLTWKFILCLCLETWNL